MELKQTKLERTDSRAGSALIMVVVLTVLLAVIGVLFVMAARIDEMATSSVVYDHELDHAVESVVELISQRLIDDLTGIAGERSFDYPGINEWRGDNWLSTVEPGTQGDNGTPDYGDDVFFWRNLSDLTGDIRRVGGIGLPAAIYIPTDANDVLHVSYLLEASADADGDGVTDSLWIRLRDVTTGRGKPVFAAVRIVDNCGMLNLNVADTLFPGSEGRYLSEIDYERFLKGADRLFINRQAIRYARQGGPRLAPLPPLDPLDVYHQNAIMHIENPGPDYVLFDISDELEIRNRFLLTSLFEARFERFDVANSTFDAGGGIYGSLQIPVEPGIAGYFDAGTSFPYTHFDKWKWRLDPNNFDDTSGAWVDLGIPLNFEWKYDRRHVCTFYSFDRNLRLGYYPTIDLPGNAVTMIFDPDPWTVCTNLLKWDTTLVPPGYSYNNVETRVQILKLLYAFRAYYLAKYPGEDFKQAARRAAQLVANMIDYVDDNDNYPISPTPGPFPGPFVDAVYGGQANYNPTYIDRSVIWQLIWEVSDYLSGGLNAIDIDVTAQYDFGIGINDPTETIYGYERQPFISEIVRYETGGTIYYAIELCNPYVNPNGAISLDGWQIKVGSNVYPLASGTVWRGTLEVEPASIVAGSRILGRAVIVSERQIVNTLPACPVIYIAGMSIPAGEVVELQRPDPADPAGIAFITVDKTEDSQADDINAGTDWLASKRNDTEWKFTNAGSHTTNDVRTLGRPNALSPPLTPEGYQMPVPDDNVPIGTLHDFEMVLRVGNEKSNDPNITAQTVTEYVDTASDEGDIRTDIAPVRINLFIPPIYPLDYVCFVGRPEGTLPGRINVNTATKEVIRAAIPPDAGYIPDYEALAANIVKDRDTGLPFGSPFRRITHLLNVPGFDQFTTDPNGVGDPDMRDDFEERDWILSRLANKLTVRSDVFTAYILVRLGHDGPQRRMIAIFDRSNVYQPIDPRTVPEKPKIIALHPVPDPR